MEHIKNHLQKYSYIYLIFILTTIFFSKIILHPQEMFYSEFSEIFGHTYLTSLMLQTIGTFHQLPLWNPYGGGGTTFLGYSLSGMFYPFNAPLYFLPSSLFHIFANFTTFLHFFLAGLFMYLFTKKIGANSFGAFISALTYSFSGKLVSNFINAGFFGIMPIILLPLMLLFLELAIAKRSYFYACILGVVSAFQFFGMHAQLFYYSMVVLVIYSIARSLKEGGYSLKKLLRLNSYFVVAVIIMLFITSFQLYSVFDFAKKYSTRSIGRNYLLATSYSLPPMHLIAFLLPDFFGNPIQHTTWGAPNYWELNAYLGITALLLASWALIFKRNFYTLFFAVLAFVSVIFSMGNYTPMFPLFYKIPGVAMFRAPSRMLHIYTLSVAVLAGIGASYLSSDFVLKKKKLIKKISILLLTAGIILAVCLAGIYSYKGLFLGLGKKLAEKKYNAGELPRDGAFAKPLAYYLDNVKTVFNGILWNMLALIIGLIIASIAFLFLSQSSKNMIFKAIIVFAILFELWSFDMKFLETRPASEIFAKGDIIGFLEKDKSYYRVLDLADVIHPYIALGHGVNIFRFHDVEPRHFRELLDKAFDTNKYMDNDLSIRDIKNNDVLSILNFKYIISKDIIQNEKYQLVFNSSGIYIYKNKNVMPRAFIAHKTLSANNGGALSVLPKVDLKSVAIVEDKISLQSDKPIEEAEILVYSPNKVVVRANTDSEGLLVFSDTWLPEWEVSVNGKKSKLYKTNHAIRGAFLKAGENYVAFTYRPPYYGALLLISLVTILALIIYMGFIAKRHSNCLKCNF